MPILKPFNFLALFLALSLSPVFAAGLAPTPPMGWANWNHFFCEYDDQTIRAQADALVKTGLRDLGYKYVLIQECIAPTRQANGELVPDAKRFPHGLPALVDYIHSRGLKAGIYTDIGPYTCYPEPRYQGAYGHELQDIRTFASWGIDLVEVDYCNRVPDHTGREMYERLAKAIHDTGRPMLLYLCSWGNERPWEWAQGIAQLWRTDADISFDKNRAHWDRIVLNFESNGRHAAFSAPESWNDPDMLEVGNAGLTRDEAQSHLAMWAISAAPLWLGNDLTRLDPHSRELLQNPEIVAVDQDPLGAQGEKLPVQAAGEEVWAKPLGTRTSGKFAVLLLNLTSKPANIAVRWSDLGLTPEAAVRDVIARKDLGSQRSQFSSPIPPHGSRLLQITGTFSWARPAVYEAEWPGNQRQGPADLLACPECSSGYAVTLTPEATLTFQHIDVPTAGKYRLNLHFVRNGAADTKAEIRINNRTAEAVQFPQRMAGWVTVSPQLGKGENSVRVTLTDPGPMAIDRLELSPAM